MASWLFRDEEITHARNGQRTAILSDGTAVWVMPSGSNNTLEVWRMHPPRTNEPVLVLTTPGGWPKGYALTCDANDNLYLASNNENGSTTFQKFTKGAGFTWTPNSTFEVEPAVAGQDRGKIDIEVLSTGQIVIVYAELLNGTTPRLKVQGRSGMNGNAAGAIHVFTGVAHANAANNLLCSVARNLSDTETLRTVAVAWQPITTSEPQIHLLRVANNVVTVWGQVAYHGHPVARGYGMLFSHAPGEWALVTAHYQGGQVHLRALLFNRDYEVTWVSATEETTSTTGGFDFYDSVEPSFGYVNGRAAFFAGTPSGGIYAQTVLMGSGSQFNPTPWSDRFRFAYRGTAVPYAKISGANRHTDRIDLVFVHEDAGRCYVAVNEFPHPPTPPGPSGTVGTDVPTLTTTVRLKSEILLGQWPAGTEGAFSEYPKRAEWRVATNPAMTGDLRIITQPETAMRLSGYTSMSIPSEQQLYQGTWFVTARAIDAFGRPSWWTNGGIAPTIATEFTVLHPPSASPIRPIWGAVEPALAGDDDNFSVAFSWRFTDQSSVDFQTAFQIVVEQVSDGAVVLDTGKITAAETSPGTGDYEVRNLPSQYLEVPLRWRVVVWDSDDVVGAWSSYGQFSLGTGPNLEIVVPTEGATVASPAPAIEWSYVSAAGRAQKEFRVIFGGYPLAGEIDPGIIHDTGWTAGAQTNYTPPPILETGRSYWVWVWVRDTANLGNQQQVDFSAQWVPPPSPPFFVDGASFDLLGYVAVALDITGDLSVRDEEFVAWRVYRRVAGAPSWTLLSENYETAFVYQDWMAPTNVDVEYVVVQVARRFGVPVESVYQPQTVRPMSESYWLLHPTDPTKNLVLHSVVADSYTDEYEEETLNLLDRGRKVEYGTRFGYSGTLTAHLRDQQIANMTARQQKQAIERLRAERREVFLRTPFGDVWRVAMSSISFTRVAGVGDREFVDVTIPYLEVVE